MLTKASRQSYSVALRSHLCRLVGLLILVVEEVVGTVRHQDGLTHRAGAGRRGPTPGIQALNKRSIRQEASARRPFFVTNCLKKHALNRAIVGAAFKVCPGVDCADRLGPYPARVKG